MGVIVCFVLPQSYCIYSDLGVSIVRIVDVEISVALEIKWISHLFTQQPME